MRFATQECAFEKNVSTTWTGHDNFVGVPERFPVVPLLLKSRQVGWSSVRCTRAEAPSRSRPVESSDVLEVEALAVRTGPPDALTLLRLRRDLFDPHLVANLFRHGQGLGPVLGREHGPPMRLLENAHNVGCDGLVGHHLPRHESPRLWRRTRADRRTDLQQAMEGITCRMHQQLAMANVPSSWTWVLLSFECRSPVAIALTRRWLS